MRGPTLPFAPTQTYGGQISVDLREKRKKKIFFHISLSLSSHSHSLPFFLPKMALSPFFDFSHFLLFLFYFYFFFSLLLFFISLFYLSHYFLHLTLGSMRVIHTSAPHVMPCVTRCLKKREIPTFSKSDEIRRGN